MWKCMFACTRARKESRLSRLQMKVQVVINPAGQQICRYKEVEITAIVKVEWKCMKVWQHLCFKPPTMTEALWPSQTLFVDYGGEISPAVAHWVRVYVQMWLIIVIWTDCSLHALLLSLHTHYIWGHAACYVAAAPNCWDLAARHLNIASATAALGMCVCAVLLFFSHDRV